MATLRTLAVSAALAAGIAGFAPTAMAGHVVVGIGLPGVAVVAPAPIAVVPPYYYGPGYFGPAYVGGPYFGYGYYGRGYGRFAPHGYFHGYAGGGRHFR
jgi:hypothetical protein